MSSTATRLFRLTVVFGLVLGTAVAAVDDPRYDPTLFQALEWRSIGPYRGGRATAVAGVPQLPMTFYFGATGGGVWKTEDAGTTWKNISDEQFNTSSVGAIAVAPSDPNVLYVGMGEAPVRGVATSHGDGIYSSTDGGKNWTHLGLEKTRQISRVLIHPSDPEIVWVAAQGATGAPTEERGIYKSTDGGANWRPVLQVSKSAGASDLSHDPTNPRILYAAFWQHIRKPWKVESGGPDGGIYKSVDGGENWEKLTEGLPEEPGKIGVAVSPAKPDRVWAIVEAEEGGLFRSDDAGKTWKRINSERVLRARAWYYTHVTADPVDADTVYVLNAPMMKSIDGGKTFFRVATPHGDNHALWIDPHDNRRMINANDGGGNVSLNAGATWSTQSNQPTGQFYRVITDRRFPYYIYGGQQDNSTVAIASRSDSGGIGRDDWHSVGGCESAHIAFDPDDPRYVYAGCYQGIISEWDAVTRRQRSVMAHEYLGLGSDPIDQPYRFNWNAPIVASPHDPSVIYHAGNHVLRTTDRGHSWEEISPDLTHDEEDKQGPGGGPITNEAAGGETYNTILSLVESEHEPGVLWAGSDDGLIHITRDGGESWQNVTPAKAGEGMVNSIEVSPHDPATAYAAFTRYKFNDLTPHIYRTADYGASWRDLASGLPDEAFVRAVREDPERPGLLFAGTELGIFVSFDDGRDWQSLQLKLPVVPITDLRVHGADLVVATQGRGFWILDDVTPLRQLDDAIAASELHLMVPNITFRVSNGGRAGEFEGQNPKSGVYFHYLLPEMPDETGSTSAKSDSAEDAETDATEDEETELTLEIADADGNIVRTVSSQPDSEDEGDDNPFQPSAQKTLPTEPGLNRFVWNLRGDQLTKIPKQFVFGSLDGYRVAPGAYQATLSRGDKSETQSFGIVEDPRAPYDATAYAEQQSILADISDTIHSMHQSVVDLQSIRSQIESRTELTTKHAETERIDAASESAVEAIDAWVEQIVQTKQETFQDVINFPSQLNAQWLHLLDVIDGSGPPVTEGARKRLAEIEELWELRLEERQMLLDEQVAGFNELFEELSIPAIIVPTNGDE